MPIFTQLVTFSILLIRHEKPAPSVILPRSFAGIDHGSLVLFARLSHA